MTQPTSAPVTGREEVADPSEPLGALSEFYRAFNGRDLGLMEQNWDVSGEASMDNPLGGIQRGWNEISAVYRRIFGGEAKVSVEFHDYTLHQFGETFLAVGRERGLLVKGDAVKIELTIRTSRWFRLIDRRWRQVHHHGSIDDPDLLARYQAAVR